MSGQTGTGQLVVSSIRDIPWFAEAVRQSRETIEALPTESRPSRYRLDSSQHVSVEEVSSD